MSIYTGSHLSGEAVIMKDGHVLSPKKSLTVRNHSPDGFEWGYGGSGPAQTALALLLEEFDKETAESFYEDFKWDVVAKFEQGSEWSLTSAYIQEWMLHERGERKGK